MTQRSQIALKVFKKTSPNSKVTVYLGKRDFVDNITKIESVGKFSPILPILRIISRLSVSNYII